jgi:hypothetical protein
MTARLLAAAVLALLVTGPAGCSKDKKAAPKQSDRPSPSGLPANDQPAEEAAEFVDVDCDKMIDHLSDIMLNDPDHASTPEAKAALETKLKAARDSSVMDCMKEKPDKRLTPAQYDCILAAKTMKTMGECMQRR